LRQLRLQNAPVQRRSRDAGFKDNRGTMAVRRRCMGLSVHAAARKLNNHAGCGKPASIAPGTNGLGHNLQQQYGGDNDQNQNNQLHLLQTFNGNHTSLLEHVPCLPCMINLKSGKAAGDFLFHPQG
jgi:hypothetical protein